MSNKTEECQNRVYPPKAACRTENVEKHFWAELTLLGKQCNAVNIGQGYPDCPPPKHIKEALMQVALSDDVTLHQYARSFGHPRLVNIMAKIYSQIFSRPIDPMNNILITVGASNALFDCAHAFINPGDEQDSTTGALNSSIRWKLDFDELECKFTNRTKLLYITNPHNPTGKVFEQDELLKIASLAEKYNVTVIADEVYEWIVYDNNRMVRFANLPEMWKRTLTIGSVGKTFSVTGWKMGWLIGPENLLKTIQTVHHNVMYMCPTPLQEAVAIGFEHEFPLLNTPESYFKQLVSELETKRDRMAALITKMGLTPIIPDGAYFMLADFSKIKRNIDIPNGITKSFAFVNWLCKENKILGTPLSPFYSNVYKPLGDNLARFCFCKKDSTFEAAEKIVESWKSPL